MRRLVIDLQDQRPFWRIPAWAVEAVRSALPDAWELVVVDAPADGSGDGGPGATPQALEAVGRAEVYLGFGIPGAILRAGPRLRWVHSGTAGVRASITPELVERGILFTNSAGVHAPPMAESVLGMILHFARGFDLTVRAQARGRWERDAFDAADSPVREVNGSTVGIVGFGGIGREVARRARALGARVLALKRRPAESPPGVELLHGPEGLERLLAESDYLVLAAPETAATRGLLDAAAIARMKPGAVLVNVARGRLVDEEALVDALRSGRLRGAALDVFATEPLAAGHPLWSLPNTLITPHVSACSRRFWERETDLIRENIGRYLDGRPLLNMVDTHAGY